jgi:hypothetical protein
MSKKMPAENDHAELFNEERLAERQIGQPNPPDINLDKRKKMGNLISDTLF